MTRNFTHCASYEGGGQQTLMCEPRSFLSFSFGGFPKYVKSCWTWLKFCWINLHIYILRIISHCKCSLIHYPIETFWVNPSSKHTTERQDRIKVQHDSGLSILLYKKIMLMQRRYIEERTKFSQCTVMFRQTIKFRRIRNRKSASFSI